ncbi:hypothetical protein Cgig2_008972 [Carnegiea gigantea]|uniref:DNA replication factor Dna2 N-terminal domain-containing protein n=1 Tax=Carnegiea gigantea TaxID=171969 RepID=A0A9Q1K7U5_9CARY|nr:hypothetical protein Cgig2_008972 [Carnegiea gigantea]
MPPRKKANASSSSSSSSKKSTQNQASQPCKYGIQHFFERHSLSSSSSQNPKTSAAAPETPKPSSERCVLQPHNKEPKKLDSKNVESKHKSGRKGSNSGGDGVGGSKRVRSGAAEQVEGLVIVDSDTQNPKNERNLRGLKRAAGAQNPKNGLNLETENTPPEDLLVDLTKSEDVSEVSPEVSKRMPRKRFKFSPGMDDGGEEVTWKISPVNERLQAISKLAPDVVKALADASRLNSSSFQQLSDDANPLDSQGKVEERHSVHILEMHEKSPMLSNGATLKRRSQTEDMNVNSRDGNVMDLKDLGDCSTQSPFRTPPSLSYHPDKALLELLDQVESAITVEEPASELLDQVENVATVEEPASEHLDQVENAMTVEEPASERLDQVENAVTVEEPTSEVLEQVENAITVEEPAVELLDQVENAMTFEEPALVESNTSSSRLCSKINDEISVKANSPIKETAMNSLEEANVSASDPCFLVLEVTEKRDAQYRNGAQCSSKVLRVLNEQSGEEQSVHLWDDWFYSVIEPGDTIRVIGEFDLEHNCVVNHEKNLVIVHPNLLLSGTRVAGSFGCPRRAVLDERLKSSEYSIAALTGILLHQIFQAGLLMENPSIDLLQEFAKITLQKNIESLYACGVQENDMHKILIEAIPKICNWIALFKHSQKPNVPSIDFGANDGLRRVNICDVIDIEEMAWAPKYGLKGVIDASVRVKIHLDDGDGGEKIMPLEFKTGKATSGQVKFLCDLPL